MKLNNKRAENFRSSYDNSLIRCLTEAYKNPSIFKQRAYAGCINKMFEMGGFDLRIMGYNTCFFTVGWRYTDPETGVIMLNVETAHSTYQIEY